MKILVLSDSHGNVKNMAKAFALEQPDVILHLGDCEKDARLLQQDYAQFTTMCCVSGNCDYNAKNEATRILTYEGYRFFMTHGHKYNVKYNLMRLDYAAREAMADVALFGHTHMPYCSNEGGIWLLNPGTCSGIPRATYGLIEIVDSVLTCQVRHLGD